MTSALSKRQQARNERALQGLIGSVPGNDRCADCYARNPGWASWNIGVFLCMRCAALHRKLGTHISKVKSLSMDSWSDEQVENMRRNGNAKVNSVYNPRSVKPPIPVDADEVDSAMERFIRRKYELRVLEDGKPKPPSRLDPSYVNKPSLEGSPPPLPPKPGKKFGFSLRSSSRSQKPVSSGASIKSDSSYSTQPNKLSRTFGISINDGNGSFESKLGVLRDMGFSDERRNAAILKGFEGDLDRTVEALVKLGEGGGPISRSRTPVSARTTPSTHSDSADNSRPSTNPFDQLDSRPSVGLSVNRSTSQGTAASPAATSAAEQPGTAGKSYNPFDSLTSKSAVTTPLEQSFQSLQVSQPLFPNTTGGYPSQQGQMPFSRYQHSMTPPVTATLNPGFVSTPSPISYNPFFQQSASNPTSAVSAHSPNFSPSNPFFSQIQAQAMPDVGNNPYFPQHATTMPIYPPQPQVPQVFAQPQYQQQAYPQPSSTNPYFSASVPLLQQPTRMDKSSILALYNFSQPPPTILEQPQQTQAEGGQQPNQSLPQSQPANSSFPPQTHTDIASQSRNPFGAPKNRSSMAAPATNPAFARAHMSQESIDIGRAQNGRHSPDIFASLSARHA